MPVKNGIASAADQVICPGRMPYHFGILLSYCRPASQNRLSTQEYRRRIRLNLYVFGPNRVNELNHVKTFMQFRDRAAWSGCPRSIHLVAITPCRLDAFLPDMRHHLLVQHPVEIGFGDEAGAHAVRGQPFAGIDLQPRRVRPPAQDLPPSPDSGLYFERKQWDFTSLAVKKRIFTFYPGKLHRRNRGFYIDATRANRGFQRDFASLY